jgi:hypothetical protein
MRPPDSGRFLERAGFRTNTETKISRKVAKVKPEDYRNTCLIETPGAIGSIELVFVFPTRILCSSNPRTSQLLADLSLRLCVRVSGSELAPNISAFVAAEQDFDTGILKAASGPEGIAH